MISSAKKILDNKSNSLILGIIFSLTLFFYGTSYPEFNWDMIGYVAAAHYQEGLQGDSLRNKTYSDIQEVTSPDQYTILTSASPYRKTISENSEALTQQMPFYTIRMAYLWTMRITSQVLAVPIAKTTYLINSFFAGLCVLLLFYFFKAKNFWLALVFPVVIIFASFPELAILSTPDAMASFIALLSLFCFQKNKYFTTLLLLTILPFIRTDFVILAGLFAICRFLKKEKLRAIFLVAPPLLAYFIINKINSNYGYLKIFNFTLIGNSPFPATMEIKTNLAPYLDAYLAGFSALVGHKHFIAYIAYFLFWLKFIRPKKIQVFNEQVFIVLGFVSLHMILFPAYFQRFFSWCVAIAGLQLASWIYELKTQKDVPANNVSKL